MGTKRPPKSSKPAESPRKAQLDALLLALPAVTTKRINQLDAYFVNDRMFACIHGDGVGLRVPIAIATEARFSRDNVSAFEPTGVPTTREWIRVDRTDAADFAKDMDLIRAAFDYVATAR